MYPHERSLVEKYASRPFAIVGINSDTSPEKLRGVMAGKSLTWSSFFDNGSTGGPIASKWGVRGWPTIYVLDAEGVIRAKNVRGPELEEWIDRLVEEAETGEGAE